MASRRTSRRRSGPNAGLLVGVMIAFLGLVGGAAWVLLGAQQEAKLDFESESLAAIEEEQVADRTLPSAIEQDQATHFEPPTGVSPRDTAQAIQIPDGTPRASISGTVQDPNGAALAGATVSIYQGNPLLSGPFPGSRKVVDAIAFTDAAGAFELRNVPIGKDYVVVAEHEDYARTEQANQRLQKDRPIAGLVIRMQIGASVSGRVTDAGEVALSGARVEFFDNIVNAQLKLADQRPWKIVLTDEQGNFTFDHVSSTAYRLRASLPGYEAQSQAVSSAFEVKAKDQTVVFKLNPGNDMPGRVVDTDGRPVGQVYLVANSLTKNFTATSSATSKDDGTFLLEGLGEHEYQLRAVAEGYSRQQRRISLSDGELLLELERQMGAELFVTTAAGEPVTAFTVSLMRAHPGREPSLTNDQRVVRSSEGRFLFDGLDPGSYALRVDATGFAHAVSNPFDIERDAPSPQIQLSLVGGGTLKGRLLDTEGEPVAGALISVHPNGYQERFIDGLFGPPPAERKIQARTGSDGRFVLKNIAPGVYQVRAAHHDSPPAIRNDVVIHDDEVRENSEIEMRLPAAASLSGRALTDGGQLMPLVTVQITRGAEFNEVITTDKDGQFEIGNLLEGNYTLSLRPEKDDAGKPLNPLIAMVYSKQSSQDHYVRAGQKLGGIVLIAPPMNTAPR